MASTIGSIGMRHRSSFVAFGSIIQEAFKDIETGRQRLVRSGIGELDRQIFGMAGGQLIVIGSRPGAGKTSLALLIASNVAIRQGRAVGVVALENSYQEVATRLLASESNVPLAVIRTHNFDPRQRLALLKAEQTLRAAKLLSFDALEDSLDVSRVGQVAQRERRKGRLDLLIVDYVQLLRNFDHPYEAREEEFSSVVRSLKHLARNLEIPVIAVSQVSAARSLPPLAEELEGAIPLMEHADLVLLLHRSLRTASQEGRIARLRIAKNRLGVEASFEMVFFEETASFRSIAA